MAAITKRPEEIKDVFATTPPPLPGGETCDACSPSIVSASYVAEKNGLRLTFCAHHTRKQADRLRLADWKITPENYDYDWEKAQASAKAEAEVPA